VSGTPELDNLYAVTDVASAIVSCALVTGGTTGLGLAIQPAVREERGDQADRPVIRLASGPLLVNNPAAGTSA
jgi:hypothetical protein